MNRVLALQRAAGNRATAQILGRHRPEATAVIQRLLVTSKQLTAVAGAAKSDILWVKMGEHYKTILAALDAYHAFLNNTVASSAKAVTQYNELTALLQTVVDAGKAYQALHTGDHAEPRYQAITQLVNDATLEKRPVKKIFKALVGEDPLHFAGQRWRQIIPYAMFGEIGGLAATPGGARTLGREPALETKFSKDTDIYKSPSLTGEKVGKGSKNQACMRAEMTGGPSGVVYVELYEGTGKEVTLKSAGYAKAGAVKKSASRHVPLSSGEPLFSGIPTLENIRQGAIGDCYLVAAIGAIVQQNPTHIYNMMRDNLDGTVTVRLYHPPLAGAGAEAVYVTVQKSLVDDDRRARGATWVALLEKAYAALGIGPGNRAISASYAGLGGGDQPSVSLAILTGRNSSNIYSGTGSGVLSTATPFYEMGAMLNYEKKYKVRKAAGTLTEQDKEAWNNSQAKALMGDEAEAFMDWLVKKDNKWVAPLRAALAEGTVEPFVKIVSDMDSANDPAQDSWRRKLLAAFKAMYPGVRGTAVYTDQQVATYDAIAVALATGRNVATGTQDVAKEKGLENIVEAKGHSAAEARGLGVVGKHAYTVISVRTDPATHLRYVKIRNPWGNYGRLYKGVNQAGKLEVETDVTKLEAQSGTFELELTDFTTNYPTTALS